MLTAAFLQLKLTFYNDLKACRNVVLTIDDAFNVKNHHRIWLGVGGKHKYRLPSLII